MDSLYDAKSGVMHVHILILVSKRLPSLHCGGILFQPISILSHRVNPRPTPY
jgi:hypothetical protein